MSAVLTMQIVHALFPSLRSTSSQSRSRTNSNVSDSVIPEIHIQPAEDMEMRPLLRTISRQPAVRHRRTSSTSSTSVRSKSFEDINAMPHLGFAVDPR
jgi:hypothetical protein